LANFNGRGLGVKIITHDGAFHLENKQWNITAIYKYKLDILSSNKPRGLIYLNIYVKVFLFN